MALRFSNVSLGLLEIKTQDGSSGIQYGDVIRTTEASS